MNGSRRNGAQGIPYMKNGNNENDVKDLIHKYFLSKWYLYVICLPICLGLARLYVTTAQPVYNVKSKLLINENSNNGGSSEDWLKRSINISAASENVSNEIQFLTSFSLMKSVIEELDLEIEYLYKDALSTRVAYQDFPIYIDTFSLSGYEAHKATYEIKPLPDNKFEMHTDSLVGTYHYNRIITNGYGTFRMRKRKNFEIDSNTLLQVRFHNPDVVAHGYLSNFDVDFTDKNSTTLEMSLNDAVPERGVDVLNTLIKNYKNLTTSQNHEISGTTLEFIDRRLTEISSDLNSIEMSVEQYKRKNDIASETTSGLELMLQDVSRLSNEKEEMDLQIAMLESMHSSLDQATNFELIPANLSIKNQEINALIDPYNLAVLERRKLLQSALPSNPVVQSATEKIHSLRIAIASAVENLKGDLELKKDLAQIQYDRAISKVRSVPRQERTLVDKERQQAIIENMYVYMLQKREETALALNGITSNSRVIDPPHVIGEVSPKRNLAYFGGFLGGLAIPFLLITCLDIFKDSIQSEEELKTLMPKSTLLGIINHKKGRQKSLISDQNSLLSERFRSLRANLDFYGGRRHQCILVTSSVKNEGKTFVASNLAITYAQSNNRTIIIDFDLRNPEELQYANKRVDKGLSTFLSYSSSIKEVIFHNESIPNLHYMPSGPLPKNPAELITQEKLDELFNYLKKYYDVVIVDTPPIGLVSDAILMHKYITKSLYVVRSGVTKRAMMESAFELFEQEKLKNPSFILNGVKKTSKYGYYHHA